MPFIEKREDFIGKGIKFPFEIVNGRPTIVSGTELIRSSIRMILGWPFLTRFFLPEFGSRLNDLIEEPNDFILTNTIEHFVIEAISNWEKRVEQIGADIENIDAQAVYVRISYVEIKTQREDNFVYPFYKTENLV